MIGCTGKEGTPSAPVPFIFTVFLEELHTMSILEFVKALNWGIVLLFTLLYLYQGLYLIIGLIFRKHRDRHEPSKLHRFAVVISARNEEHVIGELLDSLKKQNYPKELLDLYPDKTSKERENEIVRKYGAVFVIGIGAPLSDGVPHDGRAADYDDWSTPNEEGYIGLNGDLLLWNPVLGSAFEVSSMGIRVDEAALDRYEGFPNFYYKRDIKLQYKGIRTGKRRTVTAFAYIMHEDRPIGIPSNFYMRTCLEGYDTFRFDKNILVDAYDKCREVCGYEG